MEYCLRAPKGLYSPVAKYMFKNTNTIKIIKRERNFINSFENEGLSPSCKALAAELKRYGFIYRL
jgi:hypothetical protein